MSDILANTEDSIEGLIYTIRSNQVMIDSDLAKLYQVETKRINEAVKNNPEKFPSRFSWILNDEEELILRSKKSTSSTDDMKHGGRRYNTRVFTEQGVAMLSTVLRSSIAVQASIRIIDAFVTMRHYIGGNLLEQRYLSEMALENRKLIKKNSSDIKLLQDSFKKFEEKKVVNEIYFSGQIFDAYSKIKEIFSQACDSLIIIDNYADTTLLDIIKKLNVKIVIITKKKGLLSTQDIAKYNEQYHNLRVVYDNTYHDRYFVLDGKQIYHCGASINRIGYKTFSINKIGDNEVCGAILASIAKCISKTQ